MNKLLLIIVTSLWVVSIHMNAQAPSAKINNTWYEYDKMLNDRKGMDIHIDFNVNNMKGQEVKASVIFYDYNKEGLKNPYAENKYLLRGNTLCAQHTVTATYTSSHWKDLCIFMPYDQFPHGNGKNTYYYKVYVYGNGKWLPGNSDYKQISITWGGQNQQTSSMKTNQYKRHVVKTWSSNVGAGSSSIVSNYTKYSDGIVEEERHQSCLRYTLCSFCSGMGCYACQGTGQMRCPTCNGVGYTISKRQYLDLMETYSNGREGIIVSYFYMTGASFHQGTRTLYSTKQLQDCGTYWKFGHVTLSKDLQTLTYLNKKYHKCTSQEYQRLYGDEIKRSNDNYYKALGTVSQNNNGSVGSYGSSNNNGSSVTQSRPCSICYGSGWVPLSLATLVTHENSTECNLSFYGSHVCQIVQCNTCRQSHCNHLKHTRCKSCNGTGKEKIY